MSNLSTENLLQILGLLAEDALYDSSLLWAKDDAGQLVVCAMCSDCFVWGCADAEDITDDNFQLFKDTVRECSAMEDAKHIHYGRDYCWASIYASELFAARVRKERPQGASYELYPSCMWPLFDACGPERTNGLGNPHKYPKTEADVPERFKAERRPSYAKLQERIKELEAERAEPGQGESK